VLSLEFFPEENTLVYKQLFLLKMQPIENIMKLRKGYAIKLYEYFNHIQHKLDEKICVIKAQSDGIYQEEATIWNRLQEKKSTLKKFDVEIIALKESSGFLDKKRLQEVKILRERLDLQHRETQAEYDDFISKINDIQYTWKESLHSFILSNANKQKILIRLHDAVKSTFGDLHIYCSNWKQEPINRLQSIAKDSQDIERLCVEILSEIKALANLNMDNQHTANKKSTQIPKSCEFLAKLLDQFIMNPDYLDILDKIKDTDSFVQEFTSLFKDNGFTSLRVSVKMVNNLSNTEKKLLLISENFHRIQKIFKEVLEKLLVKKQELIDVCMDADQYAISTCNKWLNKQYQPVLNLTEQIGQKRNEFVVNENLL
jgi:hypothetical protein